MPFDIVTAMELAASSKALAKSKGSSNTSNSRQLGGSTASYSTEAVPTYTSEASGPENASKELRELSFSEYHQAMEQRIKERTEERAKLMQNTPKGAARRVAEMTGQKLYKPAWKSPKLTEEEEEMRLKMRAGLIPMQGERTFEYTKNADWFKRSMMEWELLKQERPWHAVKWPHVRSASGTYRHWESHADPNYRGTETDFLVYAQAYLEAGIPEHREQIRIWIAGAKDVLGILEEKERAEAKRTEILIEGREEGLKAMQILKGTVRKNCSGTELDRMAKPELKQPLGMFVLSKKQQQAAEARNLLNHPVPYVEGLEYVAINWLLFDTPRWLAYQELMRSPACAPRTYIDDEGTKRRLASGKIDKGTLTEVLSKKEEI